MPFNAHILAVFPHAHLRGKSARFELKPPGGSSDTLLEVPHYDFNWQLQYRFTEPVLARRGSMLVYTAWYDNSERNPANPDPTKAVRWGQQTHEEMHLGYVEYVVGGGRTGELLGQGPATDVEFPKTGVIIPDRHKRLFTRFDPNGDGKLDRKEFDALPPVLQNGVLDYIRGMKP